MACGLLLHNSEFAPYLKLTRDMQRVDAECVKVRLDVPHDARTTWFFRGLSVSLTSSLLRTIGCLAETAADMSHDKIQHETVPYDDVAFTCCGEALRVVYSIGAPTCRFRQSIVGPQNVSLYEPGVDHFGPVFVYKCSECVDALGNDDDAPMTRVMLPIQSSSSDIVHALKTRAA